MTDRPRALIAGVAALAAGLLGIVAPGLLAFAIDRALVSLVGLAVLVQAARVIQGRRRTDLAYAETPDPECPERAPPPGEDVESVLGQFTDASGVYFHRGRVRKGLRAAAVAVLTRYGGHSEEAARERVAAGTWTDDRRAAAFLGDESAPGLPVRVRLRERLLGGSPLRRTVRRTVDAIAAVAGVDPRPGTEDEATAGRLGRLLSAFGTDASGRSGRETERQSDCDRAATVTADDRRPGSRSRETGHWRGVSVVALAGIGLGVLVEQPGVLLAGVVGIGFAAYARSSTLPPEQVSIERTLDTDTPAPGDEVAVTVTVTNESDRFLPDFRLVDGVPGALAVADGPARLGTALRPGESARLEYTVRARRGRHTFGPALLVARDLTAGREVERTLGPETRLTCIPPLEPTTARVPLRERATQYVGQVATADGGDGVEFFATREYRPGDPPGRIDWKRWARTGDLSTVDFREERSATVVIVIDARPSAYVGPDRSETHAVDRSVDAARTVFSALSGAGNRVGIAALGADTCWLAPGAGTEHRLAARELLAIHPALTPDPKSDRSPVARWRAPIHERLSPGTQVVFLSPLVDPAASRAARRLEEYGYPVTVLSPDPTADRAPGHRLARVARALRCSSLRSAGVPVVDWPWDDPVDVALARYEGGRR